MENILKEILYGINNISTEVNGIKGEMAHMNKRLTNLEDDVKEIKTDVNELKSDVSTLKTDVNELKSDVSGLNKKMDNVYKQTAYLTEFRTSTNDSLINIFTDVKFIKRKVQDTEKDVVVIQDRLKIVN